MESRKMLHALWMKTSTLRCSARLPYALWKENRTRRSTTRQSAELKRTQQRCYTFWGFINLNLRCFIRLLHALRMSKRTLRISTRLLHALRKSKRTFRSTRLLHAFRCKNRLSDVPQGCHTLCERQNGLAEAVQGCHKLCGSVNRHSEGLRMSKKRL